PRETIRDLLQAHKKFVYATRYHWIPLQWVPPVFLILYLAAMLPASRPLGKMSSLTGSLSLLLAAGLISLWVRSYWREDQLQYGHRAPMESQSISAKQGVIVIASEKIWGMTFVQDGWSFHSWPVFTGTKILPPSRLLGFGFGHFKMSYIDV